MNRDGTIVAMRDGSVGQDGADISPEHQTYMYTSGIMCIEGGRGGVRGRGRERGVGGRERES